MKSPIHFYKNSGPMKQMVMFPAQKLQKKNLLFKRNIPAYHMGKQIVIQVEDSTYRTAKQIAWMSRWMRWIMPFIFIMYSLLTIVIPQIGSSTAFTIWGFCLIGTLVFSLATPKSADKIIARKYHRQYTTEEFKELLPASVVNMLKTPYRHYRN